MNISFMPNPDYLRTVAFMLRWALSAQERRTLAEIDLRGKVRLSLPSLTIELDSRSLIRRSFANTSIQSGMVVHDVFPRFDRPRVILPVPISTTGRRSLLLPRGQSTTLKSVTARALVSSGGLTTTLSRPAFIQLRCNNSYVRALSDSRFAVRYKPDRLWLYRLDNRDNLRSFIKYVDQPGDRHNVLNEYHRLHQLSNIPSLFPYVPSVLGLIEDGCSVGLITSPLPGIHPPPHITPAISTFLDNCVIGPTQHIVSTELIRILKTNVESSLLFSPEMKSIVYHAMADLKDAQAPRVFTHNDFHSGNILIEDNHLHILDWEHATDDGIPEWDRIFFLLQSGIHSSNWPPSRILQEIDAISAIPSRHFTPVQMRLLSTLVLTRILLTIGAGPEDLQSNAMAALKVIGF